MSIRKLEDVITVDFTTHNPTTGQVSNADTTPFCEIFEDLNDTPIANASVSIRSGKTGDYRATVTASAANGFEIGKSYNAVAVATVSSVAAKSCIASFILDGKRVNDLYDPSSGNIADAVWDELTPGHLVSESFGNKFLAAYGLMQSNFRMLSQSYDGSNRLVSATLKVYTSSTDCINDINTFHAYNVTASYDGSGNLIFYRVTE